jgi:uncharacterized repeat protein (TIGR03803 family)
LEAQKTQTMKKAAINFFLLPTLTIALGLLSAQRATGQIYTTLHTFSPVVTGYGLTPYGRLVLSSNMLYGTTSLYGGPGFSGNGTVFAMKTDGSGITNLHSFSAVNPNNLTGTNADGASPRAGLVLSGNTLYGTTAFGGTGSNGVVFAVNTDGSNFTNLHNFTSLSRTSPFSNSDGAHPYAELILSGNTLYGTTTNGGSAGLGTVFAINTDGGGFTNLHSFTGGTNGANPYAGLIVSGGTLYGTTFRGGDGIVFSISTNGTGFQQLFLFLGLDLFGFKPDYFGTAAELTLSGNTLFGATLYDHTPYAFPNSTGELFSINTDGSGFTNFYNFSDHSGSTIIDSDGANPYAGLVLSGNVLYGTTTNGGTIFRINTNGTGFTTLHHFPFPGGTANSLGQMILSSNTLYGVTSAGAGSVFSLFVQPQLAISNSGANVVLSWPTNSVGFTLQSTSDPGLSAVWNPVSPAPVVVNGLYTVTNPISGTPAFYRLSQ